MHCTHGQLARARRCLTAAQVTGHRRAAASGPQVCSGPPYSVHGKRGRQAPATRRKAAARRVAATSAVLSPVCQGKTVARGCLTAAQVTGHRLAATPGLQVCPGQCSMHGRRGRQALATRRKPAARRVAATSAVLIPVCQEKIETGHRLPVRLRGSVGFQVCSGPAYQMVTVSTGSGPGHKGSWVAARRSCSTSRSNKSLGQRKTEAGHRPRPAGGIKIASSLFANGKAHRKGGADPVLRKGAHEPDA